MTTLARLTFPDDATAERALKANGFAIGSSQRDDPRGVMFGYCAVAKWRNLTPSHRAELHGTYRRDRVTREVTVTLRPPCPREAATALVAWCERVLAQAGLIGEM